MRESLWSRLGAVIGQARARDRQRLARRCQAKGKVLFVFAHFLVSRRTPAPHFAFTTSSSCDGLPRTRVCIFTFTLKRMERKEQGGFARSEDKAIASTTSTLLYFETLLLQLSFPFLPLESRISLLHTLVASFSTIIAYLNQVPSWRRLTRGRLFHLCSLRFVSGRTSIKWSLSLFHDAAHHILSQLGDQCAFPSFRDCKSEMCNAVSHVDSNVHKSVKIVVLLFKAALKFLRSKFVDTACR